MSEEEIIARIKNLIDYIEFKPDRKYNTHFAIIAYPEEQWFQAIQGLLDLYNKEKEKNKELNKENLEIRDWKYVIDSPIDLDKLKELDLIKIKGKEYVSKDKIKAKIKELEKIIEFEKPTYEDVLKYAIEVLQSLLEKE